MGKKNKLTRVDFDELARNFKINEKSLQTIYKKFEKVQPKWLELIQNSFLSNEMKADYQNLIQKNMKKNFRTLKYITLNISFFSSN